MKKESFDNIIFDLGGVVIDLDRQAAVEALKELGLSEADKMLGLYRQEEPFLSLETGHATAAAFYDTLRRMCRLNHTDLELQQAFNAFLTDLPIERLKALRDLRTAGYRTFVISNTNPVMYLSWISDKFRQEGLTVNDYFDGIVTSFAEFTCKPDPYIFTVPLKRYGLEACRTLMLDDSEANCEAARSTGMSAWRVDNTSENSMINYTKRLLNDKA